MADLNFSKQIIHAVEERTTYFNTDFLPRILEKYRLIHTCTKNLIDVLTKKSLIKPDPYKLEKRISDIEIISNDAFLDTERTLVISTRLSDYEFILDFICTYHKFSVENIGFQKIKKLIEFNNTFIWSNLSEANASPNTRGLATLINEAKRNNSSLSINALNDSITKCAKTTKEINLDLKELNDFQREVYKAFIRKDIFDHPKFNLEKANKSPQDEFTEIKSVFSQISNKQPFYTPLIDEIVKEDFAPNKAQLQAELLKKLHTEKKVNSKQEKQINSREILMTSIQSLAGLATQFEAIIIKLKENRYLLDSEDQSFFKKLIQIFRKAFNLDEKQITYSVNIIDSVTGAVSRENINFVPFIENIEKRILFYNSFSLKQLPGYQKIEKNPPEKILDFLNKHIAESQRMLIVLTALDDFFKNAVSPENKPKIKGIKMELTTVKNTIINTNQHKADYMSLVEEQEQMKKLGITNA